MSPTNQFIAQVRHRIDLREKKFKSTVDALYSIAALNGQVGALRQGLFDEVEGAFAEEVNEVLEFVSGWGPIADLDEPNLLSLTVQLLAQSAIGLKSMVDLNRLDAFCSSSQQKAQTRQLANEAFASIDLLLQLRMQEFKRRRESLHIVSRSERTAFGLFGKPHIVPVFSAQDAATSSVLAVLKDFGFEIWDRSIPAGEDREDYLLRAVSEVSCVLGFFSSLDGVQLDALRVAFDQNKLLPVVVGDKPLPFGFTALEPVRIMDSQRLSETERQRLLEGAVRLSGYHPPIRR